ncbi:MAG: hypothetical protein ABIP03_14995 [Aquihabitans sp.]
MSTERAGVRTPPGSIVRRTVRSEYVWAAGLLALLTGVFFSPVIRSHATFSTVSNLQQYYYPWIDPAPTKAPEPLVPQVDQADYIHPRQVFIDTTLRRTGELPRWNPDTLGGTPFMAEAATRLAYPPYLAFTYLLNPVHFHDAYVMLHLFVAGMAMFALMKAFGARFSGALLSGVAWMFGSYTIAWAMLEMFPVVAALLPLALLLVYRWHSRDSRADLAAASLVLGLMLLGTSLELAFVAFVVAIGYAGVLGAWRLFIRRHTLGWRDVLIGLAEPALVGLGSLAVAAVVLLPFLALSDSSQRGPLPLSYQLEHSVPVRSFADVVQPPDIPADAPDRVVALISDQVFVGTATAVLAVIGLFRRRPGRAFGAVLVVVMFLFATGSVVARVMYVSIPFLSRLGGAGRALFVFDLGLVILGGLGLDTAVDAARRAATTVRHAPRISLAPVAAAITASACIGVTSVQLLSYGRDVNAPFQSRAASALFPSTPVVDAVKDVTGRGAGRERVLVLSPVTGSYTMAGTVGLALDLPLVNGYELVVPANVSAIWRTVDGVEDPHSAVETPWNRTFQLLFSASTVKTDLLARLGVAAVLAPPGDGLGAGWSVPEALRRGLQRTYVGYDGQVFAVTDRVPRALVVGDATWVRTPTDAIDRFVSPTFDVRREVVIEGPQPTVGDARPAGSGAVPATIGWLQDDPNQVRLAVDSPSAGWLVLLDNWDPGWKATVGGRSAKMEKANFTQRAVRVPAGASVVTFTYRPSEIRTGRAVSAASATGLVGFLAVDQVGRRRRRAAPKPAPSGA